MTDSERYTSAMRNLTATICLTIAVLLRSAGVSWSADKPLESEKNNDRHCLNQRCTDPITEIRIGKFFFEAKDCTPTRTSFESGCVLLFGNGEKNIKKKIEYSSTYRIVNGPVPFSLDSIDGQCVGFSDFRVFTGDDWVGNIDRLGRQSGEKVYFHRDSNETFSFFNSHDKSIGVLINSWGASGHGGVELFVYNTQSGESAELSGDCEETIKEAL